MTFVHEHRDRFAVALLLRLLDIAESTYYQWVKQAEQPSDRDLVDLGLISNIYEIWEASGCTYGADRVHQQLRRDGIRVGRKRVERLMAAQGWHGAFLRRGWRGGSTKQDPRHTPAPDLVNRQFTAAGPDPAVGRRRHPDPVRGRRVLAGRRPGRVLPQNRRVEDLGSV
jgi:putative transposase